MKLRLAACRGSLSRIAFIVLAICLSQTSRAVEYITSTCDARFMDCTATADVGCADTAAAATAAPNYGGCCWCRSTLFGDCRGCRSHWADNGVTVVADHTHFYYGVASGGLEREFRYVGHGDYVFNFDFDKLCDRQGLFLKLRAEHRFGEPISSATGAFFPSNISANLPVPDSEDLYLTNVLFTQFLSESFGVFAGKLDTLDGDANAFAHGRGKTQFSNLAFVANPALLRTIPYSTLGTGFVILRDGQPFFTYTLLNSRDTVRTSGFDELFAEGVAMSAELMLPTNFGGLPGRQVFAATWNSRDFVSLG